MYNLLECVDYGIVKSNLKQLMDYKGISIYKMSQVSQIKYDIVKKYYYNDNFAFTGDILAKFCFILKCDISDILIYVPTKESIRK